jgi:hypothetical protein
MTNEENPHYAGRIHLAASMKVDSTEEAVNAILVVLKDEAQRLGADLKLERKQRRGISNEMVVSVKRNGQTFRITLGWVRDDHLDQASFHLGNCYIETQWRLLLEPEKKEFPVTPPYHWRLKPIDPSISRASHSRILDAAWLRRLMQKKLALPQES